MDMIFTSATLTMRALLQGSDGADKGVRFCPPPYPSRLDLMKTAVAGHPRPLGGEGPAVRGGAGWEVTSRSRMRNQFKEQLRV